MIYKKKHRNQICNLLKNEYKWAINYGNENFNLTRGFIFFPIDLVKMLLKLSRKDFPHG